jgi:predicted transcriptional regulator
MNYQNDVSVIVEDDVIKVIGEDTIENTIKFLKSNSYNKAKVLNNRTSVNGLKKPPIIRKEEYYIERLYAESLREIYDFDKIIVKEVFIKDIQFSRLKRLTLLDIIKKVFKKKKTKKTK